MVKTFLNWGCKNVSRLDVLLALFFIAVFTFEPHYSDGPLNLFELGLYLPSIDGVLHGLVPFKDFFYLRGPFEIYIPALIMKIFGENVSLLSLFFYAGNVICLGLSCLIGAEIFRTRSIFYTFIPALVARAFPRAVFPFWGGLRYIWGLLFVYLMIQAFKTQRGRFFIFAGLAAACAALTSIEIGVCCFLASLVVFIMTRLMKNAPMQVKLGSWGLFASGGLIVLIPVIIYFWQVKALVPFVDDMQAVIFRSHPTFMTQLTSSSPKTFVEFLLAMIPNSDNNFKYMTPLYSFLFLVGLLAWRYRRNTFGVLEFSLAILLVYAVVLYMEAFRIIEGGQFETALQVEKIVYFFLIEVGALWVLSRYRMVTVIFLTGILIGSLGYALDRYYKRFPILKIARSQLDPKFNARQKDKGEASQWLSLDRAYGVRTSLDQATELEWVVNNVEKYTDAKDKIFVYPDMGAYYFFAKRNFAGHFPIGTMSWMREDWHEQLMQDLNAQMPKLIILETTLDDDYTKVYFKRPSNEQHYKDVVHFVDEHYDLVASTAVMDVYKKELSTEGLMKISGFTIVRNAVKFNYPVVASICSILPICDEFIVNVGDSDDGTLELIRSINSPKIRIIQTQWDMGQGSSVLSQQTNIALKECRGDWAFYLQSDEVIHEADLNKLRFWMQYYLDKKDVDALRLWWFHFYGSYWRYRVDFGWYQKQDRIIRNNNQVESYGDAFGFRRIDRKPLRTRLSFAYLYHYGWVNSNEAMQKRCANAAAIGFVDENKNSSFTDGYGDLNRFPPYWGTHPAVMKQAVLQHRLSVEDFGSIRRQWWWNPFFWMRLRYKTGQRVKERML